MKMLKSLSRLLIIKIIFYNHNAIMIRIFRMRNNMKKKENN